jgi:phosphate transport system ATP-binding protein
MDAADHRLRLAGLSAAYPAGPALTDVTLAIAERVVTAVVGPSGCGKSTLLRCLNRMHETVPGATVRGAVHLDGVDIYAPGTDVIALRRRVGLVLQHPTPFPTRSVRDNVLAGAPRRRPRGDDDALVEALLRQVGLWGEVRDRLRAPATGLSVGQQQRLCIARALATGPTVLLLDEPTAALDPANGATIEALLRALVAHVTVVLVTHNLPMAARVSDRAVFLLDGRVVEAGATAHLFTAPQDPRTEAYLSRRLP